MDIKSYKEQMAKYIESHKCGMFPTHETIEECFAGYNGEEKARITIAVMTAINTTLMMLAKDIREG